MALYPFSVKDVKIGTISTDSGTAGPTYGTNFDFQGVQELSLAPDTGNQIDLRGDDVVLASSVQQGAMRFTLRGAGIPLAALKTIFDFGSASTGTAPNDQNTYWEKDNASPPNFGIAGLAQAPDGGDVIIFLPKCRVQGTVPPVGLVDGAFTTSEITGTAYFTTATYSTATGTTLTGISVGAGTRRVILVQRNGTTGTGTMPTL